MEGDDLFGRGASDDKGQAFAVLTALESYFKTIGKLPINVKILLEGEEEMNKRGWYFGRFAAQAGLTGTELPGEMALSTRSWMPRPTSCATCFWSTTLMICTFK
jgi:acetylornithine deacetylase/succinyl-diaminopimelate desuccinylase-like protein